LKGSSLTNCFQSLFFEKKPTKIESKNCNFIIPNKKRKREENIIKRIPLHCSDSLKSLFTLDVNQIMMEDTNVHAARTFEKVQCIVYMTLMQKKRSRMCAEGGSYRHGGIFQRLNHKRKYGPRKGTFQLKVIFSHRNNTFLASIIEFGPMTGILRDGVYS
jgi:hypothetical protein